MWNQDAIALNLLGCLVHGIANRLGQLYRLKLGF
jgi:hypothetical protein